MSARPPAVELRWVSHEFTLESGQKVQALRDVNLTIPAGQFVCVIGPSGHGKSTLINMIAGFLKPSSGEVRAAGKLVEGAGPDRGVVFQKDTVFLWKRVAENIEFGMKARGVAKAERDEKVRYYLKKIDLEGYGAEWPKQLSGGMRRRVAIATVFANEPEVLLMDEPFTGLDYARRSVVHEVLTDLWSGSRCTVVFVTHDIDEAISLADRVLVVVRGQIVHEETITLRRPRGVAEISSDPAIAIRERLLERLDPKAALA
jgi:NitT/TauT family transport system ATP-binding protein